MEDTVSTPSRLVVLRAPGAVPDATRGRHARPAEGRDAGPGAGREGARNAASAVVEVQDEPTRAQLRELREDPGVLGFAAAMPLRLIEPLAAEEAGPRATTWGVDAVGAPASPFTGDGVTVAVLDTGIDAGHPAFAGVDLVLRDFTGSGSTQDENGHGTHCAGTVFGRDLDGERIGVAPGIGRALIGKVLGGPAGGGSDALASAVLWAAEGGANVISMSLGIDFPGWVAELVEQRGLPVQAATSIALEDYRANIRLFEQLANLLEARAPFAQTALIVAAAGNESERDGDPAYEINVSPPAAAHGVVSVAALGEGPSGFTVAPFSNTLATVAGPGVGVRSAWPGGGTRTISGTSMATPHVAGVAALWAQRLLAHGPLAPVELRSRLVASGTHAPLASGSDPLDVGAGLVQAPRE
ncbi:S8 family peptidase [Sinomonas halotolerans]|uniref:S8 family serine peptidase n=1 Tax=Sinomonas halotolerans TaxID=1644133 RepID=A0ABU9WXY3_9MICC